MSQPVALVAKINLTETAFKKFLRTKSAKQLAGIIDQELSYDTRSYYIFRYLKKEQALFAFFYFNYGNAQTLQESEPLDVLKSLALFAEPGDAGYILAHIDALNFRQEDVSFLYRIHNQQCISLKQLPAEEWEQLRKDISKYFYKEAERDFAGNFFKSRIVDKSIVNRCRTLAKRRNMKAALQDLHTASLTRPVHCFGDYYYNGKYVYHQHGLTTILKEIDPKTFIQTPYGAADAHHVVVGPNILQTDVSSFKKLQKEEAVYYKSNTHVYDQQLVPLNGAEASSFKVIDTYHATDSNHVYFGGNILAKEELGAFKILKEGYYNADKLLAGEKAVFFGSHKLDVDPASFKLMDAVKKEGAAIGLIYIAKDQKGTMVIYNGESSAGVMSVFKFIRTDHPDKDLQEIQAAYKSRSDPNAARPPQITDHAQYGEDKTTYVHIFEQWAALHFRSYYEKNKYKPSTDLYTAIGNYFHASFQLKQYGKVIDFYKDIKDTAWINPSIFYFTACCYVASGQYDEAFPEIRKAVVYGYEQLDKIWNDAHLEPLWEMDKFIIYKKYHAENPYMPIPIELLEAIVLLPPEEAGFIHDIALRLPLYDAAKLTVSSGNKEEQDYLTRYKILTQQVFDRYFLRDRSLLYTKRLDLLYYTYKNYASLHPQVHLEMLQWCFYEGHGFRGHIHEYELDKCTGIIDAVRRSVAQIEDPQQKENFLNENNKNSFFNFILNEII